MEAAFIGAGAIVGSSFILWALQRCGVHGSLASARWPPAPAAEVRRFQRMSDAILAAYESDLERPRYSPNLQGMRVVKKRMSDAILAAYDSDLERPRYSPNLQGMRVVKKVGYARGPLQCPPYVILVREGSGEVVVAIRGMHLLQETDYVTFLRTWRAHAELDCGYVHRGFLLSAQWLLAQEASELASLLQAHPGFTLVFTGHSEGAGVAALCAIAVACGAAPGLSPAPGADSPQASTPAACLADSPTGFPGQGPPSPPGPGQDPPSPPAAGVWAGAVRCVAFAPPRVASRALCRKHWAMIDALVLQDDFLPRTSVPVHIILGAAFCLPVVLAASCLKDMLLAPRGCASEEDLQVPGKLYHIVYTKFCSCRSFPPQIRQSESAGDDMGQIVCSANALEDHSLLRARAKLDLALEDSVDTPPSTLTLSPLSAPALVRCTKDGGVKGP